MLTLTPFACRICKNEYQTTGMGKVWFRDGYLVIPSTCKTCTVKFAEGMEVATKNQKLVTVHFA